MSLALEDLIIHVIQLNICANNVYTDNYINKNSL